MSNSEKTQLTSKTMDHASEALSAFMAQLGEIMSMEDGATPADYLQRARDIREWCHDHQTPLNFVDALKIAEAVFEQYRKDQPKWWRRMDGTPILNDVAVRMAEAFRDAARPAPETPVLPGELEQLRRIDRAAREFVNACEHKVRIPNGPFAELCNALFDGRPAQETPVAHCIDCIELKNALAAAVGVANEARECHDRDQDMRTMKLLIALSGHLPKWRADTDRIHDVLRRAVERLSVKANERELSPSEAASFDKALARSPRRVDEKADERCPYYVNMPDRQCRLQKGHTCLCDFPDAPPSNGNLSHE